MSCSEGTCDSSLSAPTALCTFFAMVLEGFLNGFVLLFLLVALFATPAEAAFEAGSAFALVLGEKTSALSSFSFFRLLSLKALCVGRSTRCACGRDATCRSSLAFFASLFVSHLFSSPPGLFILFVIVFAVLGHISRR
jgi:hypothetical protein